MSNRALCALPKSACATFACVFALLAIILLTLPGYTAVAHGVQGTQADDALVATQVANKDGATGSAAEPVVSGIGVKVRPCLQDLGWQSWVSSGKVAGTKTTAGLRSFKLKLSNLPSGIRGSIRYRAYDKGYGWGRVKLNGKTAGRKGLPVQAVRVWLTGDVSKHYDVLYRLYIRGHGWQLWSKNKAVNGVRTADAYATAMQVLLSPKTEEAAGKKTSTIGVRYEARMTTAGWQKWVGNGRTAGKAKNGKVVDGFALKVDPGKLTGGVKYRAYIRDKGWSQGWKRNGVPTGVQGRRIEALQIVLTGALSKSYDIYYRTYVRGYGWLHWAKNGVTSGSTGLNYPITAIQAKLVKKGAAAPGKAKTTTVNQKIKTLNGIDISSWQAGIDLYSVLADFVIIKTTGGVSYTNPYYKSMANATLKSGKLLGLYHFACEYGKKNSATSEADYFVNASMPYIGKAVLVLDWEADALKLGPDWAKKFLDRVYARTKVRPLIYMSKYPTNQYNWAPIAKNYKLWVAQYANNSSTGYQRHPWTDDSGYGAWSAPTIFQYSSAGRLTGYNGDLDLNIFYGGMDDWKKLAAKS